MPEKLVYPTLGLMLLLVANLVVCTVSVTLQADNEGDDSKQDHGPAHTDKHHNGDDDNEDEEREPKLSMKELEDILGRGIMDKLREAGVLEGFLKAMSVPRDEIDAEDVEESLEKVNTPRVVDIDRIVAAVQDDLRTPKGKAALQSAFEDLIPKVAYSLDEIENVLGSCKVHFDLECMQQALKNGIMAADALAIKGCINDDMTRRRLNISKFRLSFDSYASSSGRMISHSAETRHSLPPSPCLFVKSAAESLETPHQAMTGPAALTGIQPGTEDEWTPEIESSYHTLVGLENEGVVRGPGDPATIIAQATKEEAESAFADISKVSPLCSKFRMAGSGIQMIDQETKAADNEKKAATSPSQTIELKRKAHHYEEVLELVGSMLANTLEKQGKSLPPNLGDVVKVAMDIDRLDELEGKYGDAEAVPPLARVLQATRIWCLDHHVDSELKAAQTMIVGERSVKSRDIDEEQASHAATADSSEAADGTSTTTNRKSIVMDANTEQVRELKESSTVNQDGIAAIATGEKPADLIAEGLGKVGKDGTVDLDGLIKSTAGARDIGSFGGAVVDVFKNIPGVKVDVLRHAISTEGKVNKEALREAFAGVPASVGIVYDKLERGICILSDAVAILNLHEALTGSGVREGVLINGLRTCKANKLAEAFNHGVDSERQVDGDGLLHLLKQSELTLPKANAVLGKRLGMLKAGSPLTLAKLMKRLLGEEGEEKTELSSQIESRDVPDMVRAAMQSPSTPDDREVDDEEERTTEKSAEYAKVAFALGNLVRDMDLPHFLVAVHAGDEHKVVTSFDEEVRSRLNPELILSGFRSSNIAEAREGMAPFFDALKTEGFKLLFDSIKVCLGNPELTGHEAKDSDISAWKSLQDEAKLEESDVRTRKNETPATAINLDELSEQSAMATGKPSLRKRFK